jgi:hypothetical protein
MTTPQAPTASHDASAWVQLGELCAGLLIIWTVTRLDAATFEQVPAATAAMGLGLALVARHMWTHDGPRSLRWLCVVYAVVSFALALMGAIVF